MGDRRTKLYYSMDKVGRETGVFLLEDKAKAGFSQIIENFDAYKEANSFLYKNILC